MFSRTISSEGKGSWQGHDNYTRKEVAQLAMHVGARLARLNRMAKEYKLTYATKISVTL